MLENWRDKIKTFTMIFTLVGIPAALVAIWAAQQPARDHRLNPVQLRGLFRFINAAGKVYEDIFKRPMFPLDPEKFQSQLMAIKAAEHDLYGALNSPSELTGLRALFQGLSSPGSLLSPLGRFLTMREINNRLQHRRQIAAYASRHPDVLKEPVHQPLIITGFPRSGSSFLQRLLATDPRARSPYLWEMRTDPSPRPPAKDDIVHERDPRIEQVQRAFDSISAISPDYLDVVNKYHETKATNIDEEVQLLRDCMWNNIGGTYVGDDRSYQQWIRCEDEDKSYMYRYLKAWLQVQSSTYRPESHWLLKTPTHAYFLPALTKEFPDANLVFTHRDPLKFVASACKLNLVALAFRVDFSKFDAHKHGQRVLYFLKDAADRIREFANGDSEMAKRALHILYEDLVADPVGTVERIYAHFGYQMTDEFRDNIGQYLAKNRQHKHGKPSYSLEEFGLNEAMVQNAFADYNNTFRHRVA